MYHALLIYFFFFFDGSVLGLSLEIYIPFKVFRHSESDWVLFVFRCEAHLSMGQCLGGWQAVWL